MIKKKKKKKKEKLSFLVSSIIESTFIWQFHALKVHKSLSKSSPKFLESLR